MLNLSKRSYEPEMMYDLKMEGEVLASTLRQIAMVNKWLGGSSLILGGIKKIIKKDKAEESTQTSAESKTQL